MLRNKWFVLTVSIVVTGHVAGSFPCVCFESLVFTKAVYPAESSAQAGDSPRYCLARIVRTLSRLFEMHAA